VPGRRNAATSRVAYVANEFTNALDEMWLFCVTSSESSECLRCGGMLLFFYLQRF
jgi:hypothetical protein